MTTSHDSASHDALRTPYRKPAGVVTRWASFENPTADKNSGGKRNRGAKGYAFDSINPGETRTLLDVRGSGLVTRIWMTMGPRTPELLRSLTLRMYWDDAQAPAVAVPLGDFFCAPFGDPVAFESAWFANPEGRSFNCYIPMPFRKAARITITNDSGVPLTHLFYDVDILLNVNHADDTLYFHAVWKRDALNTLGEDFVALPTVRGAGRFLGCNVGVIENPIYERAWYGEGEVAFWLDDDEHPTLCGTGSEDYMGSGWGQGVFSQRCHGSLLSNSVKGVRAFYRLHVDDPIYFDRNCRVAIETIGGALYDETRRLHEKGVPLIPVTVDMGHGQTFQRLLEHPEVKLQDPAFPRGWVNWYRQDDWYATAWFYLDSPEGQFPRLQPVAERIHNLSRLASATTAPIAEVSTPVSQP